MTSWLLVCGVLALIIFAWHRFYAVPQQEYRIKRAEKRLKEERNSPEQTAIDVNNVASWNQSLALAKQLQFMALWTGIGLFGLYGLIVGLAWARFYGWIG